MHIRACSVRKADPESRSMTQTFLSRGRGSRGTLHYYYSRFGAVTARAAQHSTSTAHTHTHTNGLGALSQTQSLSRRRKPLKLFAESFAPLSCSMSPSHSTFRSFSAALVFGCTPWIVQLVWGYARATRRAWGEEQGACCHTLPCLSLP